MADQRNDPTERRGDPGPGESSVARNAPASLAPPRFVPLVLSDTEREILMAEPTLEEVEIRPDNGGVYMPEIHIRKRLNAAFGAGAWTLWQNEPAAYRPDLGEVVYDATLIVRESAVARACGSARWKSGNAKGMDYGSALESARSTCLRRCAKDLGIGAALWEHDWREAWKQKHAHRIEVENRKSGVIDWEWHRKDRPAPWNAVKKGASAPRQSAQGRDRGRGDSGNGGQKPSSRPEQHPAPPASNAPPQAAPASGEYSIRDPESPATDKQLAALDKMCAKLTPSDVDAQLRERGAKCLRELSKGEASAMIAWAQNELGGGG